MFDAIAPRYDLLNRVMTFGMDRGWRRRAVSLLRLPRGSVVLDVACGTGDLCNDLLSAEHRAIGVDSSSGMLAAARTSAPLVQADALVLPVGDGAVDGITCGFALRNVVDLAELLAELARVTRRGGRIALLEVAEPQSAVLRVLHGLYFRRFVPLVGGLLSDKNAYSYLPRSTAYLPPHEALLSLLEASGWRAVERKLVGLGAAQMITGTRL